MLHRPHLAFRLAIALSLVLNVAQAQTQRSGRTGAERQGQQQDIPGTRIHGFVPAGWVCPRRKTCTAEVTNCC